MFLVLRCRRILVLSCVSCHGRIFVLTRGRWGAVQICEEPMQHPADVFGAADECLELCCLQVAASGGDVEVRSELSVGSRGHSRELTELFATTTREALGDICHDGGS